MNPLAGQALTALSVLLFFTSTPVAVGTEIRVPGDHASIQEAIDMAADGDVILLAEGDYDLSVPLMFHGKKIALRGAAGSENTTLVSTSTGEGLNSRSILILAAADHKGATVSDLTFKGGRGTFSEKIPIPSYVGDCNDFGAEYTGGAIFLEQGAMLTIESCVFDSCSAFAGGAIACYMSTMTLQDCTFKHNSPLDSGGSGGAVSCSASSYAQFTRCSFDGNVGQLGGAVSVDCFSTAVFESCTFTMNEAFGGPGAGVYCNTATIDISASTFSDNTTRNGLSGAGVHVANFGTARIGGTTFRHNTAADAGGALAVRQSGVLFINDCLIDNNRTPDFAAGLYCEGTALISNTIFSGNSTGTGSAAIEVTRNGNVILINSLFHDNSSDIGTIGCHGNASVVLKHCTMTRNSAGGVVRNGEAQLAVLNSILWDNPSAWGSITSIGDRGGINVTYSCVQSDVLIPGEGNIAANPLFAAADDFHITTESAARDRGLPISGIGRDLDGYARRCGAEVDMGAYEYGQCRAADFLRSDVDGDGRTMITDVLSILSFLFLGGSIQCLDSADLQDSGSVNIADAVYLLTFLFKGEFLPAAPWPVCGTDPSPDNLPCELYASCGVVSPR
jgi:hypothetical protein